GIRFRNVTGVQTCALPISIRIVIVIPTLIILFLLWGFPITLSILFPLVFMWRYLNIINASILGRENSYIKVSLGLATIYTLVIQDVEIIIYTFGLFIVLMFGDRKSVV